MKNFNQNFTGATVNKVHQSISPVLLQYYYDVYKSTSCPFTCLNGLSSCSSQARECPEKVVIGIRVVLSSNYP